MKYLGNIPSSQTLDFAFNTHVAGVATTLGGSPVLSVYKSNSTTQTTTGVTLTVDFDSLTGLNHVRIVTGDSFYVAGDYRVVITTGTVGGNSVVGVCVAEFSIANRAVAAASGAYTYTVTVTSNGSTPVNGARVRLSGGAEARLLTTGSNGVAAFSADAGTYTLSVTASGYTYTPTTVTLSGNATATITLTAVSIPAPADASQTTAYTTCRDGQGVAVSNAAIYFRFKARAGDADSYDRTNFTATSNGAGLLTVSLPRNAQMQGRRGLKGAWIDFTTGDADTYELPQLLGGFGA